MRLNWPVMLTAGALVILAGVALLGCSKSTSATSPYGGGYGNNPPPPPSLELNSGNIPSGGVYQHTFANAGSYLYHCSLHSCMTHGTVTVAVGQPDSIVVNVITPGTTCAGGFSPLTVSIKPGGHVRWVNESVTHTVTSD